MEIKPALAVVYAGNDPLLCLTSKPRKKAAKEIGVDFLFYKFSVRVPEKKL